jgi:predicted ATPase
MITACTFTAGYPLQLPLVGKRTFKFTKGFNIIFGPNACGKSTLLTALANYSSIKTGGWSKLQEPLDLVDFGQQGEVELPAGYTKLNRKAFEAKIDWDGTPTFYHHARTSDSNQPSYFFESAEDSHDGITTMDDQQTR